MSEKTNGKIFSILIGLPASGKSTFAEAVRKSKKGVVVVSTDAIRFRMLDTERTGKAFDLGINDEVFAEARRLIREALSDPNVTECIFDATNVTKKGREQYIRLGREYGARVSAYLFPPDVELALRNNQKRERKVPEDVIREKAAKFDLPTFGEFDDLWMIGTLNWWLK